MYRTMANHFTVIKNEIMEMTQSSEELHVEYETSLVKVEDSEDGWTEDSGAKEVSEKLQLSDDLEGARKEDSGETEVFEEGQTEEEIRRGNHNNFLQVEDSKDGWPEEGDDSNEAQPLAEPGYQTYTLLVKDEPVERDCPEEVGANLQTSLQSSGRQGGYSGLESSTQSMRSTQQMSGDRSPHGERHLCEHSSSQGVNPSMQNVNQSRRNAQEMLGDRSHDNEKHLEAYPLQAVTGTQLDSSKRGNSMSEHGSDFKPNQVAYSQEQCAVDGEVVESARSHLKHRGINTGNEREHEVASIHVTEQTSQQVPTEYNLYEPRRNHMGEQSFHGCVCKTRFSLNRTELVETLTQGKLYKCTLCHKFKKHVTTHTEENQCSVSDLRYEYSFDSKGLSSGSNLQISVNTRERPYECTDCNKRFSYMTSMKRHMRIHTRGKPYQCSLCNKEFSRENTLTLHITTHTGEEAYQCSVCDARFAYPSSLSNHTMTHARGKPYQCSVCSKTFAQAAYVSVHMRSHTGEQDFHCTFCKKGFSQNIKLQEHMRTHTGEKPYHCPVCEKGFAKKSAVKPHLRTHTGEKPYQCSVCYKSFSQSWVLKRHMKIHTN